MKVEDISTLSVIEVAQLLGPSNICPLCGNDWRQGSCHGPMLLSTLSNQQIQTLLYKVEKVRRLRLDKLHKVLTRALKPCQVEKGD